jgi:membrane protease YdiL (CAAX protease family)
LKKTKPEESLEMSALNIKAVSNDEKVVVKPLSLILICALLFLRIPFLAGLRIIFGNPSPEWIEQVFEVCTFLLTAVLIWVERDELDDFYITPLALAIILLFKPVMPLLEYFMGLTKSALNFPKPFSFIYLIISISLFVALRFSGWKWRRISPSEWRWLGIGTLAGVGLLIILSFPMAFTIKANGGINTVTFWDWFISFMRIPQQLGYAAITEEPLFRGFLWGILIKYGWKNGAILLFQTILFMIGHAYYFNDAPLSLWILVPLAGITFGFLVWRSRTLASSLACHSIVNAFGYSFGQVVGQIIFK